MSLPCTVCHFPSLHPSRRAIVKLPVPCTQQNSGEKKEEMAALTVSYSTICYSDSVFVQKKRKDNYDSVKNEK